MLLVRPLPALLVATVLAVTATGARADQVTLNPTKDATLYEDADGALANGSGQFLFAGRTSAAAGTTVRRALLQFDVAGSLPPGAIVTGVSLDLHLSRKPISAPPLDVEFHRVTTEWSEGPTDPIGQEGPGGTSVAGDSTWIHTTFDTAFWTSAGGDFLAAVSAAATVDDIGDYSLTDPQLTADVQDMLDNPSQNFGWILIGDETDTRRARRFDSRTGSTAPSLRIDFLPAGAVPATPPSASWILLALLALAGGLVLRRARA